jgi:dynactin 1
VKAAATVNAEAEVRAAQLADELQGLARTVRARDGALQEAGVRTAMLERRLEAARKTGEALAELEAQLEKARRQERTYEEAMEQLQSDLDTMEKENAKLKQAAAHPERTGRPKGPAADRGDADARGTASEVQRQDIESVAVEGSLETSYLLEQVCQTLASYAFC